MTGPYFPAPGAAWEADRPTDAGLDPSRLARAVAFAEAHESRWPRDLERAESLPGLTETEKPPWNEVLGPLKSRGGPSGLVLRRGRIVARWGEPARVEMTFSVAKSYLGVLAGIALGDGLIESIDAEVARTVPGELFASAQNRTVTWRHLLEQTSEWEGTLWDKPDLVDRNRQLGPGADMSRKGEYRGLRAPGAYWEYNDVRVNVLSLALLHAFARPLPEVLKSRVMDPIGAGRCWRWLGYRNSYTDIGGERMQSVPGGTHWGGGIQINSFDHARFALLVHRHGLWRGERLLPEGWVRELTTPSALNENYGYLWWLNTGRKQWPGAPASAYAAIGAGSHVVLIDPDHDLVLVARWIDQDCVSELVSMIVAAVRI